MALLADLHQQQGGVRTNFSSEQYSLVGGLLGEIEYWILSDIKLYQENNNKIISGQITSNDQQGNAFSLQ